MTYLAPRLSRWGGQGASFRQWTRSRRVGDLAGPLSRCLAAWAAHTACTPNQLRRGFGWCEANGLDALIGIQRAHVELPSQRDRSPPRLVAEAEAELKDRWLVLRVLGV